MSRLVSRRKTTNISNRKRRLCVLRVQISIDFAYVSRLVPVDSPLSRRVGPGCPSVPEEAFDPISFVAANRNAPVPNAIVRIIASRDSFALILSSKDDHVVRRQTESGL